MSNMTVKDLKGLLANPSIQDYMEVWLSRDEEGNGFAPVPNEEGYSISLVKPTKWGWADDIKEPAGDPVADTGYRKVLLLWPDA